MTHNAHQDLLATRMEFTRQREALTRRTAMRRDANASKSLEESRRLVTAMIDLNS
jgi:hypothetical protein